MNWIQKIVAKIGMDKIAHFFGCAFLTLALGRFVHWAIVAGLVLALGVAKELWDGVFDWRDILADTLGVALGVVLLLI